MKKKILSVFLVFTLLAAYFPAGAFAAGAPPVTGSYGQFLVNLNADDESAPPIKTATGGPADGFGTADSAGRIWTGKDVQINAVDGGSFDVTLSALAQEYTATAGSGEPGVGGGSSSEADMIAADVTFILDMSTSMNAPDVDGMTRVNAMAKAANDAIDIVLKANSKNRVAVYWFGGYLNGTHVGTLMARDSYTLDIPESKEYLVYTDTSGYTITTNSKLQKSDGSYLSPQGNKSLVNGTPTQDGIMYGVSKAMEGLGVRSSGDPERKPYVFVLSDGAAIQGRTDWANIPTTYTRSNDGKNLPTPNDASKGANSTYGSADIAAVTILTGRYMKNQIEEAYKTYNSNGEQVKAQFYTVGLGADSAINGGKKLTDETKVVYAWAGLDPGKVSENHDKLNFDYYLAAKNTHAKIQTYSSNYPAYSNYANDYVYSDFYTYADNYSKLKKAFDQLASDVEAATTILPLLNLEMETGLGNSANADMSSAIAIVDEIGDGFALGPETLKIGSAKAELYEAPAISGNAYKFDGYKSKVVVKQVEGKTTLIWYIDADDMQPHIYRFADRTDPKDGDYNAPTNGAFKLNYNLKPDFTEEPTDAQSKMYPLNSGNSGDGAKTTAYFTPPKDSPYYETLATTYSDHADPKKELKTPEVIGADYVSEENWESGTSSDGKDIMNMTVKLGNNGKLELVAAIVKDGPAKVKEGGNIEYGVTIYNYTKDPLTVTIENSDGAADIFSVTVLPEGVSERKAYSVTAQAVSADTTITSTSTITLDGKTITSNEVKTVVVPVYEIKAAVIGTEGGTVSGGGNSYENDDKVALTAEPNPGYEFVGWYEDGDDDVPIDLSKTIIVTVGNADKTYYAKFALKKYRVIINVGQGGSVTTTSGAIAVNIPGGTTTAPDGEKRDHGDVVQITATPNAKYKLDSFIVTATTSGAVLVKGVDYTVSGYELTINSLSCDVAITVSFLAPGEITFNYNGGPSGEAKREVEIGTLLGQLPEPVRDGYTFGGWEDSEGKPITSTTPMDEAGIAAIAKWVPNSCTITLMHNGGSGDPNIATNYDVEIADPPSSAREGYTFEGWYSDPALQTKVSFSYTVKGSATWYANWVKNKSGGYIETEVSNPGDGTGDNDVIAKDDEYTLHIKDGDDIIHTIKYTITDKDDTEGKFTLIVDGLPDGDYTVVLEGPKPAPGQEITERVVIKDGKPNIDPLVMTLAGYIKNTKLTLKTPQTPSVTVSGLNKIYETDALSSGEKALIETDNSSTTITLFAEKVNDGSNAPEFNDPLSRIKRLTVGQKTALYLDLTLNKAINPADTSKTVNESMPDAGMLLTISIPLPTVNGVKVTSYRVYRDHDGEALEIKKGEENANVHGEYCEPITADGRAILHVRYFSLYAFTYTPARGDSDRIDDFGTSGSGTPAVPPVTPPVNPSGKGTSNIVNPQKPVLVIPGDQLTKKEILIETIKQHNEQEEAAAQKENREPQLIDVDSLNEGAYTIISSNPEIADFDADDRLNITGRGPFVIRITEKGTDHIYEYQMVASQGLQRLAGANRVDTALAIAKGSYYGKAKAVVVARSDEFPDALTGSVLAYQKEAPVLLVGRSEEDCQKLIEYLKGYLEPEGTVYILGQTVAVSQYVEDSVKNSGFSNVIRLGGADRYGTAARISEHLGVAQSRPVVIASGQKFPDSLSVSSIAAAQQYPLLIVNPNSIPNEVKEELVRLNPSMVYIIGLQGAVSDQVKNEVAQLTGIGQENILRIGGQDRYESTLAVAQYFDPSGRGISIATGRDFPDALAGSVYSARMQDPLILVEKVLSAQLSEYIKERKPSDIVIFGGQGAVSPVIEEELKALVK